MAVRYVVVIMNFYGNQPDLHVSMENTAEIIGPLPPVAPPVLGLEPASHGVDEAAYHGFGRGNR